MKLTNRLQLPDAVVRAVQNDPYDNGGAWRSVTQLISPPRQIALKKQHENEIEEDVAERLHAFYGQLIHSLLERANVSGLVEKRLFMEISGKKISGQFDSFDVKNGVLTDWKFSTAYKAKELPEEWVWQMNMLRVLLQHNGFSVNQAEVVLLMRDHSKLEAKRDAQYPQLPIARMPVPLWSFDKALAFLEERVRIHLIAEHQLPECSSEERWAKPDTWAVMKQGRVTAVRVLASEADAHAMIAGKPDHYIQHRPGANPRCESYCSVAPFCSQYQAMLGNTQKKAGGEK